MKRGIRTLTTGEIAKYCGVSFVTVIRWIDKGKLKGHQLPGRGDRRVKVEDFVAFLESNGLPVPDEFISTSKKVLVVDDDLEMTKAMHGILTLGGFTVRVAHDGFAAGQLIENFSPAVVTMDLKMPGLNGVEVIRRIRSDERFSRLKILVVSGMPKEEIGQAIVVGADDFLSKPFKKDDLIAKLDKLLE